MKVLITGAGGFVGPHLVAELTGVGHECVALDRNARDRAFPCRKVTIDLNERDALEEVLSGEKPDAVIHLAGWSHVGKSWEDPAAVYMANTVTSVGLYHAVARTLGREVRFVHVSSGDVYTPRNAGDLPLDEGSPVRPESPYAASKLATEDALGLLARRGGPALVILRPFNHVGPGQAPGFALPSFARQIVGMENGSSAPLRHGNLSSRRDFTDVRDVARAYRLVLEAPAPAPLYVVASGRSVPMEQIVLSMFRLVGIEPRLEENPALFRPIDTPDLVGNPTKIRADLGWEPSISLETTLSDILDEARRLKVGVESR